MNFKNIVNGELEQIKELKEHMDEKKVYSDVADIPSGHVSDRITPGCLVLEGGAFRGVYGEGVLDAWMEEDLNFECVIGVSAGALNGLNYASGQIGRSARINLTYRHDSRYVGLKALKNNKGIIGFDFVFDTYNDTDPLDSEFFFRPEQRYVAVATNCLTGEAEYFEKGKCKEIFKAIQASASMPYVSKMVNVDGIPCLDGGCACKIPYQWALDQGYKKIIVVKTRDHTFRKKVNDRHFAAKFYRNYPEFAAALDDSNAAYNRQCNEIESLEKEGHLFVVSPGRRVHVSRVESDMEKLGELYHLGYRDGKRRLQSLKSYLAL